MSRKYDHFEVLQDDLGNPILLGKGGMGETFKAHDTRLHCLVALKVIAEHLLDDKDARERFFREARMATRIRHINVASVIYLSDEAARPCFYAMEYVDGITLGRYLKRSGPQKPLKALQLVYPVSQALIAAADVGVVHRDLKPDNIMLIEGINDEYEVKLIDFGLARRVRLNLADDVNQTGFMGTVPYASPEQIAVDPKLDERSDIYSLGITLWEMLVGQRPFTGDAVAVMQQHLHAELPQNQISKLPKSVRSLLLKMLEKDPADRHRSARELSEDIVRCLAALGAKPPRSVLVRPLRAPEETTKYDPRGEDWEPVRSSSSSGRPPIDVVQGKKTGQRAVRRLLPGARFPQLQEAIFADAKQIQANPDTGVLRVIDVRRDCVISEHSGGSPLPRLLALWGKDMEPARVFGWMLPMAQSLDFCVRAGVKGLSARSECWHVDYPGEDSAAFAEDRPPCRIRLDPLAGYDGKIKEVFAHDENSATAAAPLSEAGSASADQLLAEFAGTLREMLGESAGEDGQSSRAVEVSPEIDEALVGAMNGRFAGSTALQFGWYVWNRFVHQGSSVPLKPVPAPTPMPAAAPSEFAEEMRRAMRGEGAVKQPAAPPSEEPAPVRRTTESPRKIPEPVKESPFMAMMRRSTQGAPLPISMPFEPVVMPDPGDPEDFQNPAEPEPEELSAIDQEVTVKHPHPSGASSSVEPNPTPVDSVTVPAPTVPMPVIKTEVEPTEPTIDPWEKFDVTGVTTFRPKVVVAGAPFEKATEVDVVEELETAGIEKVEESPAATAHAAVWEEPPMKVSAVVADAPTVQVDAPVARTNAPAARANTPVVQQANAPVVQANAPAARTPTPVARTDAPAPPRSTDTRTLPRDISTGPTMPWDIARQRRRGPGIWQMVASIAIVAVGVWAGFRFVSPLFKASPTQLANRETNGPGKSDGATNARPGTPNPLLAKRGEEAPPSATPALEIASSRPSTTTGAAHPPPTTAPVEKATPRFVAGASTPETEPGKMVAMVTPVAPRISSASPAPQVTLLPKTTPPLLASASTPAPTIAPATPAPRPTFNAAVTPSISAAMGDAAELRKQLAGALDDMNVVLQQATTSPLESSLNDTAQAKIDAARKVQLRLMNLGVDTTADAEKITNANLTLAEAKRKAEDQGALTEVRRLIERLKGVTPLTPEAVSLENQIAEAFKKPLVSEQKAGLVKELASAKISAWTSYAEKPLVNSLKMTFVTIPAIASKHVRFSIYETRRMDYQVFVRSAEYRPNYKGHGAFYPAANKGENFVEDKQGKITWQNPGFEQKDDHPVVCVSQQDAMAFCNWLTEQEKNVRPRRRYRLPTDEEWSAAAGPLDYPWEQKDTPPVPIPSDAGNFFGKEGPTASPIAREKKPLSGYKDDFPRTAPVGRFRPNYLGLYDMAGNAAEWTSSSYQVKMNSQRVIDRDKDQYTKERYRDGGIPQVLRGGSWYTSELILLETATRDVGRAEGRSADWGFRCVLEEESY